MRLALPKFPESLARFLRRSTVAGLSCTYLGGMAALGAFAYVSADLPDTQRLWEQTRPPSIQIVDRNGRDLAVRGAQSSEPLPIEALPPHVRQAVLSIEDRRFYSHSGIDPYGLARALVANWRAGEIVEGGSTLTQQLTKNVFLTPEQTLTRKAQEMIIAVWLERRFTKNELLRMYLSRVYFGGGAWGLEAASERYFGRAPDNVSLSEAALLAGLLKAPSALSPVHNPERAAIRMRTVLRSMDRQGLLAEGVLNAALKTPVSVLAPRETDTPEHFIDWIWPEIEEEIGIPNRDLVIQVSLDRDIQRAAQRAVKTHLNPERNASEAALVMLGDRGEVLAMVGGANYARSQFNRAVQAKRQPGSSFKPIVYLAAMRHGMSPWTQRIDAPITIDGWEPRNFKPRYLGAIPLEDALAQSINTVAVRISEEVGRETVVATASSLGLEGFEPFASLALGAQDVRVIDMAAAYLPFSTGGDAWPEHGLLSIATAEGTPLYWHERANPERVLSTQDVRLMNRMLVRTTERGTGRRARVKGRIVAGKTGTTNDNRDAWFVGYAPGVTLAVWVGNDENAPMRHITGGTIPADIFSDVMTVALSDRPVAHLPQARENDLGDQQLRFNALLDRLSEAANAMPDVPIEN